MTIRKRLVAILCAQLMAGLAWAQDEAATQTMRALSPALSAKVVAVAVADCAAKGYMVAAAVVGRDGNLQAFLRAPLAGPHTVLVSQQKAFSSASFQVATGAMGDRTDLAFAPGILLIQGGMPIDIGGHFYGGVAVSGAEPSVDEECAVAGIDAIRDELEFAD